MPTTDQLRQRLIKKLNELFQLDQPDLDFGFYRIMHARAKEVQSFINNDLLNIVSDAFGDIDEARKAELKAKIDMEIAASKEYGASDPENSPKVREARAAYEAFNDSASSEADIYEHLYRFFERYYDNGDFISRRYYTRETSAKAAPFAIPYNGEEVKLHWANADQYYIKTSEYFSNFTFDLRQVKEIRDEVRRLGLSEEEPPLKVHFRVVDATEGEHGNVKVSEQNKRYFIIHQEKPVELTETGELVCNFEYRPDPEKTGQEGTWRDKRNSEAVESILSRLQTMSTTSGEHEKQVSEYLRLFKVPAPTDSDKKRPVLAKYVNQYTARNTMDYFIHKNLGGFLRRELDFYIKNEVMRLDDIENAEAPAVESYLAKIKVLRKIAGKLIDFLAQLEDFQKKLWLKKKFIIETNYCITLDRVPEGLYPEVATCDAQCEEWIRLFAIDEIQADLHSPGFTQPLTVEFLKANNKLVLDTRFFDDSFKARLLASIENFDEQCDGLLILSENFQALNLLQERYREQVKCVYIDPPYNTESDRASGKFIYKDSFERSSWLSLMSNRLSLSLPLAESNAPFFISIDEHEYQRLAELCDSIIGQRIGVFTWVKKAKGSHLSQTIRDMTEFVLGHCRQKEGLILFGEAAYSNKAQPLAKKTNTRKTLVFPENVVQCTLPDGVYHSGIYAKGDSALNFLKPFKVRNGKVISAIEVEGPFVWTQGMLDKELRLGTVPMLSKQYGFNVLRHDQSEKFKRPSTILDTAQGVGTNENAFAELTNLTGAEPRAVYPKPTSLIAYLLRTNTHFEKEGHILDYFAGSGTTAHAVIRLNREDDGKRKYILVEMGDYFDTVLKPRIAKVVYSDSWKDGKPTARHTGISHCFKYIRLESYEDTLNNLRLDDNHQRQTAVVANPALKEDYMLRYLLDVETRGSQSLLNIDAFADPCRYTMEVKKPGTDEYATRAVDLIETFNYLIGLRVLHTSVPQTFTANFQRMTDPELPLGKEREQPTKLVVEGRIRQDEDGPWWFRKVEGWVPKNLAEPNNGQKEKVLIVWRKLTGDIEQDNLMLDEWFQKNRISIRDFEFDTIYVNGSNNLPNLKLDDENWKVRLIEEEFMKRMWTGEGVI